MLDVVTALDPFFWWEHDLFWKTGDATRDTNKIIRREVERCFSSLVIQAEGRRNGLGHPVERDVSKQFVAREDAIDVPIAI